MRSHTNLNSLPLNPLLWRFFASSGIFAAVFLGAVNSQAINVPNGSFESPTPPPGFPATPVIDNWQKPPTPAGFDPANFGGLTWFQLSGIFPNPPLGQPTHIDNVHGDQGAYVFSVPGVGLSQELPETFEQGFSYTLSAGLLRGGGLAVGSVFSVGLYYLDGANPVFVASAPITVSLTDFPSDTHLYDFNVTLPQVQAGDAWAGKQIGLGLNVLSTAGGGYWDIDNVRLTADAVPEPETIWLTVTGLGIVGARFWLSRRKNATGSEARVTS